MHLRRAVQADAYDVATINVRAWQTAYRGLLEDDYLAGLRPEDRARRYAFEHDDPVLPVTLVAVDDGITRGFATTGPARDDDVAGLGGELLALYVDPASWNRGIGRELIAAARATLRKQGFSKAVLWVLVGNERAQRFYEIDGWSADGSQRRVDVWGVNVDEIRYVRPLP